MRQAAQCSGTFSNEAIRCLILFVAPHSRVEAAERETLESLNRSLWAWIEGEYHQTPHRGLDGRTPLECKIWRHLTAIERSRYAELAA